MYTYKVSAWQINHAGCKIGLMWRDELVNVAEKDGRIGENVTETNVGECGRKGRANVASQ